MSKVIVSEWDSHIFGGKTGQIDDHSQVPESIELSAYKYVHVRLPQEEVELVWQYQRIGFRYITLDYSLEKKPINSKYTSPGNYNIVSLQKQQPNFQVSGFKLLGSRLVIDPELNQHLSENFWDKTIQEHCRDFADFALCAVNQNNRLIGFVSCFDRTDAIDMFLFLVHPDFRHTGVSKTLMATAEARAYADRKKLTTSVVANNLEAMNFYFRNGFIARQAYVIMHYSNS